jgi:hypothetical protein
MIETSGTAWQLPAPLKPTNPALAYFPDLEEYTSVRVLSAIDNSIALRVKKYHTK